ncbi:MAG: HlyD family efflux transporter periplasmic adaptor subunit [Planctomycetaceae bacterium]|nr:HlyD family efflux transporter periplasmic adaptor subunit [Planctomycetaceae bacterium]
MAGQTTHTGMLNPAAYSEQMMPSLRLARSSRIARLVGKVLLITLILSSLALLFAPWQQSVTGSGSVIAYSPSERPQVIETPIKGRIAQWGENIYENALVKKGDLIAIVKDIDESYTERLQATEIAAEGQVQAAETLQLASQRNLEVVRSIVASQENQLRSYRTAKENILTAADAEIEAAQNKVKAQENELAEHQATLVQAKADYERQKQLFAEEIASEATFQDAERKYRETLAKVDKAKSYIAAAKNELSAKISDREAKSQKAQVDIDYAIAAVQKAESDIQKAESDLAKSTSELNKAKENLLKVKTQVARQPNEIRAPFDGYLTQISPNQGGKILKEHDPICTIVPATEDRAVQIILSGLDAPLVSPGRHVRLQFEGWPAIQFAGWPSVAVGTFGGHVVSVDASATDGGEGKVRILILPEEGEAWPEGQYLRQGVRVNAWVILERVPLWFELWRRMNGFPPSLDSATPKDSLKVPKLPKQ